MSKKINTQKPDPVVFKHMSNQKIYWLIFIFLLSGLTLVKAQEKVVTAGIQYKPIFSSKFFNSGPVTSTMNGVDFKITPDNGYCLGMTIRKGITRTVSFESGINYVKRNFELNIKDTTFSGNSNFSIIGYEIPVMGLIFIQLSDHVFMDVALGLSLDFYASDVRTSSYYFNHFSSYNSWFSPSVLANLGWEYRTEKSGYFYIGASYHRPFETIYYSVVDYIPDPNPENDADLSIQGNYLTLDLRYFFHSDPQKRKKKVRKTDSRTK